MMGFGGLLSGGGLDCFSVRASAMPRGAIGGGMGFHGEEKKKKGIGRKD